jgi:hypothetical protein
MSDSLEPKYNPPVYDVFYLHKYPHGFSQFPWLVIRFFRKASIVTVATLHPIDHAVFDTKVALMEATANMEEDGEVEIDSDEEHCD